MCLVVACHLERDVFRCVAGKGHRCHPQTRRAATKRTRYRYEYHQIHHGKLWYVSLSFLSSTADALTVSLGLDESDNSKSTLTVYKEFFEAPFINRSRDYYATESKSFLAQHPVTEYLKRAEVRLKEEEDRLQSYMHNSTHDPLIKCVETVLIAEHQELIQNEFQPLLNQDRLEDLGRMYGLLVRVPGALDRLRNEFETHVKQQGLLAADKVMELSQSAGGDDENAEEEEGAAKKPTKPKASDQADPKVYVESLLAVHKKFADLTASAFRGDAGFSASLDKACREFVNRNSVCKGNSAKSPELLARFCDALLRKGTKIAEDSQVDNILNQVVRISFFFFYADLLDDPLQVCRRQGCLPKVLFTDARKTTRESDFCK